MHHTLDSGLPKAEVIASVLFLSSLVDPRLSSTTELSRLKIAEWKKRRRKDLEKLST